MRGLIDSIRYMDKRTLIGLLVFVILLIALPLILLEVKTQQEIRQRASSFENNSIRTYPCGTNVVIRLQISEDPSCPSGSASITSFKSSAWFSYDTNKLGQDYKIHWKWQKFFCPDNKATGTACLEAAANPVSEGTLTLVHGTEDHTSATTGVMSPSQSNPAYAGQACGWYQNDLGFEVLNPGGSQLCDYHITQDLGQFNANFSQCQTHTLCTVVNTPTPTTPIATATPTTPVNTPTNSPTPEITLTDTPTGTPPATTDTPTDTPPPGSTPTPTPTSPPGSTPTPTSVIVTSPKPTLPPTGPGETIFGLGIVGIALALVGVIFVLAF